MTTPASVSDDAGQLADVVARAARGCAGVVDLASGAAGEVATYLPGRRVPGVRLGDDRVEVHVVAAYGVPLPEVAERIRVAVAMALRRPLPVDVYVDDIDTAVIQLP